ncbi:hypothetical protein DPMN_133771 [Dreissena polymorpha]|uniref:Uncharacterized protein n=1 Tax=Dreissena polymorpha TaxID=45954 RepID=A0A9D4FYJ8_DREPO|nr:hypothetical protein DPMN_133771 [Dreissena polymorpha]
MVSLDNGDLLKCNIQDAIKNINPEQTDNVNDTPRIYRPLLTRVATDINTIGNNVEGELLRQHKKGIIYMCFVENLNALVTWKYNSSCSSVYVALESDSDKPKKPRTRQELAAERQKYFLLQDSRGLLFMPPKEGI